MGGAEAITLILTSQLTILPNTALLTEPEVLKNSAHCRSDSTDFFITLPRT